ncbi:MAG: hypothetical protein U1E82_08300 [Nitrosomonas sp.]
MTAKILIVGIGNRYRGDDGLGCFIVDELKNRLPTMWKSSNITAILHR